MVAPLFRWAGSKRKLLSTLIDHAPSQIQGRYFEPFAGSACLFLALRPKRAVLGDINPHLIDAYKQIQSTPHSVYRALARLPKGKKSYYRLRALEPHKLTASIRAARFIFLNRYCFNGVYRTNKQGRFNVPYGRKTGKLPTRRDLLEFSAEIASASFRHADFESCISRATKGDFVYLDPPYVKPSKRNRGEYGPKSFSVRDMDRLLSATKAASKRGATILVSYANSAKLKSSLPAWKIKYVKVARSIAGFAVNRSTVQEILLSNR